MATPGASFAEAYVMRKLYKQKLKENEAQKIKKQVEDTRQNPLEGEEEEETPNGIAGGCFFWSQKKIHPKFETR